jgi:hypothetical protein
MMSVKSKNIHVLSTKGLSRLVKGETTGRLLLHDIYGTSTDRNETQNIYITSDEEIKDGDFAYDSTSKTIVKVDFIKDRGDKVLIAGVHSINLDDNYTDLLSNFKKIILTTDQDLIKYGVHAIDDEFLEWFVKNPSCESVDVVLDDLCFISSNYEKNYKIIIPKEIGFKVENGKRTETFYSKEEPKQETLEEFAKRIINENHFYNYKSLMQLVIMGAKWQQEQDKNKYSVEEHTDILEVGQILVNEETLEYGLLQHIKMCLECNNESQAIRLLEKYGFEKQEERYSEEDMMKAVKFGELYKSESSKSLFEKRGTTPTEVLKKWFEQFKNK